MWVVGVGVRSGEGYFIGKKVLLLLRIVAEEGQVSKSALPMGWLFSNPFGLYHYASWGSGSRVGVQGGG